MLELLKPILVIVVGYLIKLACAKLGIELDEATYNAIVAAIVVWLLGLFAQQASVELMARVGLI